MCRAPFFRRKGSPCCLPHAQAEPREQTEAFVLKLLQLTLTSIQLYLHRELEFSCKCSMQPYLGTTRGEESKEFLWQRPARSLLSISRKGMLFSATSRVLKSGWTIGPGLGRQGKKRYTGKHELKSIFKHVLIPKTTVEEVFQVLKKPCGTRWEMWNFKYEMRYIRRAQHQKIEY